jgi:hypothetical protein
VVIHKYEQEKALQLSDLKMPSGSNGARHHPGEFGGRGP